MEIAGLKVDELAALLLGGLRGIIFAATTGTLSPSGLRLRRSCLPGRAGKGARADEKGGSGGRRAGKWGPFSASCLIFFCQTRRRQLAPTFVGQFVNASLAAGMSFSRVGCILK